MYECWVAGTPVPQGSMKGFNRGGRVIITSDSPGLKPWRAKIAQHAGEQGGEYLEGPVRLTCVFVLPRPKSVPTRKRPRPSVRPDLDKLVRAVGDGITGVWLQDDSTIVEIVAEKFYEPNTGDGTGVYIKLEKV